jgi:hypothetical protein
MMQSNVQWQTAIGIHLLNLILKDLHEGFNKDMRALCFQGSASISPSTRISSIAAAILITTEYMIVLIRKKSLVECPKGSNNGANHAEKVESTAPSPVIMPSSSSQARRQRSCNLGYAW